MELRSIGSLRVSVVGLGTNSFGTDFFGARCGLREAKSIVGTALDVGINFFDTAEEYSVVQEHGMGHSEEVLGISLGSRRDEAVIATKFQNRSLLQPAQIGAARIIHAVEGSLRRLGTDRIDLFQQHFPDADVPVDETLEAMDRLVTDGKILEIGCSNFTGAMLDGTLAVSSARSLARFVSAQNRYNLIEQPSETDIIERATAHGCMLIPAGPLASGLLTGKYSRHENPPLDSRLGGDSESTRARRSRLLTEQRFDLIDRLQAFALERDHSVLDLAMSWLAAQPVVGSIIAGATRPSHVTANVTAAGWALTPGGTGRSGSNPSVVRLTADGSQPCPFLGVTPAYFSCAPDGDLVATDDPLWSVWLRPFPRGMGTPSLSVMGYQSRKRIVLGVGDRAR